MFKIKNDKLDYSKYSPIGIVKAKLPDGDEYISAYLEVVTNYNVYNVVLGYELKFIYLKEDVYFDSLLIDSKNINLEVLLEKENEYTISLNSETIIVNNEELNILKKISL